MYGIYSDKGNMVWDTLHDSRFDMYAVMVLFLRNVELLFNNNSYNVLVNPD